MRDVYRVIDANLNRLREGLRVLEEIARFILEDAEMTAKIKDTRHRVTAVIGELPGGMLELIQARDAAGDVGAISWTPGENTRGDLISLTAANFKRAQEAARVLEEFCKLIATQAAREFKKIRFEIYEIELDMLKKMS
ncbi:hypothetical protein L7E55_03330 [Pelotomaculum isophthalicicum JI]|uniref:ThiD2 domain-containing protein n=1 Tax=Pelotomaculum isophthalicicum JI TaxID=947010 RepID=A0A9X4H744_9FIRM|nr:hypothetical protein [Pelotomaculum isophthalicicum]MDF9407399.1 hypothetical protein [Pelotomaculum isophthalicicum JI]